MEKSVVSIAKATDPGKMVEEALSLLGGLGTLVRPNSTVVVEPNTGHDCPPESSLDASPAVVAAAMDHFSHGQRGYFTNGIDISHV